jgi:hypothetical protein
VGNGTSYDRNQESRILGSEVEIKHHEKTEEDDNAWRLLINNIPVNEGGYHAKKGANEIA